jgi:hypothetical protein
MMTTANSHEWGRLMSHKKCDESADTEGRPEKIRPEVRLLQHQLQRSIPANLGRELRQTLISGTIKFYDEFGARSRLETLPVRHMVILNNVATECFQRGIDTSKPEAQALIGELCRLLENQRRNGLFRTNDSASQKHPSAAPKIVRNPKAA